MEQDQRRWPGKLGPRRSPSSASGSRARLPGTGWAGGLSPGTLWEPHILGGARSTADPPRSSPQAGLTPPTASTRLLHRSPSTPWSPEQLQTFRAAAVQQGTQGKPLPPGAPEERKATSGSRGHEGSRGDSRGRALRQDRSGKVPGSPDAPLQSERREGGLRGSKARLLQEIRLLHHKALSGLKKLKFLPESPQQSKTHWMLRGQSRHLPGQLSWHSCMKAI